MCSLVMKFPLETAIAEINEIQTLSPYKSPIAHNICKHVAHYDQKLRHSRLPHVEALFASFPDAQTKPNSTITHQTLNTT